MIRRAFRDFRRGWQNEGFGLPAMAKFLIQAEEQGCRTVLLEWTLDGKEYRTWIGPADHPDCPPMRAPQGLDKGAA